MSAALCDDDCDDAKGSTASLSCGADDSNVVADCECSTIISSTCDEDLLETDRNDARLAESIVRSRTSLDRADRHVTSSQTSTDPVSSTEFEESSRNDSISRSHGASHSTSRGRNSLSGYTACLSDDASADSSPTSPWEPEMDIPPPECVEKGKELDTVVVLRWSDTVNVLPALPKDTLQAHATQEIMPPLERRSTASALAEGPSDRTENISAVLEGEGMIHDPEPGAAPIVALPVPTDTEAVDAVAVSIVERNEKTSPTTAKRRNTILFVCLVAAIVITVSAAIGGACGSGGCASDSTPANSGGSNDLTSPSRAKLDDRKSAFFSYINNVTFGRSLSPYENDSTPEGQALMWLINSDPLQLGPQNDSFRIRQRYALLTFWFHSDNSNEWSNSTGWLENDDECTWFGILCSDIDHGSNTGVQRTVTFMDLGTNGISGIIPSDLGLLSNLQYFALDTNQLYGSIPSSIGQWTDLEHLQLELQLIGQLTGQIPESVGNLRHLLFADFSYNLFTGELPSSIGNWTDIVHVDFSGLLFNCTIPSSVGNWTSVEFVSFMSVGGDIHGTLPESIGNWVNLTTLSLIGNDFSGTLPPAIAAWTNLHSIDLSYNEFSGTIPKGVLNWTSLETMYLSITELTGGVPEGMCMLSNLTTLEGDCDSRNFTCSCCSFCS
jgi:hypothetical protein